METNLAHKYEGVYKGLEELGQNPILLQSFALNNNADITKAIEFYTKEMVNASEEEKVELLNLINRHKQVMKRRLEITEDIYSVELPALFHGPSSKIEDKPVEEEKEDKKVIQHPASKDKKVKTVNEKLGENKNKEEEKKEETPKTVEAKTEYDKLYPTEEEKLKAINKMLPGIEKDLNAGLIDKTGKEREDQIKLNDAKALRKLKHHLKSWGEYKPFCTPDQIKSLIVWLRENKFTHLSPFAILRDQPLSIADILKEAEKLVKEDGLGEQEVKGYLEYYIMDNQLAEQKKTEIIRTQEEYDKFFQQSIVFLFDEQQREQEIKKEKGEKKGKDKDKVDSKETRNNILEESYKTHKKHGIKAIGKMAKDLHNWVRKEEDDTYSLDNARATTAVFIKHKDPKLYEKFDNHRAKTIGTGSGTKTETPKDEVKKSSEETDKVDGAEGKTDTTVSEPVVFDKLERILKHKNKKKEITEFLIAIINKHVKPIGTRTDGMTAKIGDITKLANKAFLENGVLDEEGNELSDWTEKDVLQYMGEDVVPYITDEYGILKCQTEEELIEELEFYMRKYDIGEQKKRTEALRKVLISEVPRTSYMKTIAKGVRKDDFSKLDAVLKKLADKQIEKQKKTK